MRSLRPLERVTPGIAFLAFPPTHSQATRILDIRIPPSTALQTARTLGIVLCDVSEERASCLQLVTTLTSLWAKARELG